MRLHLLYFTLPHWTSIPGQMPLLGTIAFSNIVAKIRLILNETTSMNLNEVHSVRNNQSVMIGFQLSVNPKKFLIRLKYTGNIQFKLSLLLLVIGFSFYPLRYILIVCLY